MSKDEFQQLIKADRGLALQTLFDAWVAEWMEEGEEEIVRVLTLWAERGYDNSDGFTPRLFLGDESEIDADIMKLAEARNLFGEEED